MTFTAEEIEKIKATAKNLKIKTISKSEDPEELPQITFHSEEDLVFSFYMWTKWQKKEWWIENYEVLELLKKHLQANINRHKLKEMNNND